MAPPLRNVRRQLSQGRIFWREVGHQGPTLIFLHGSWQTSSQWLPLLEQLGDTHHCFAPDLLGFGDSEHPKVSYSIELETECLAELVEALHLRDVYLVGHSLGGWIAASYGLKYLDRVKGLILIAPEGVETQNLRGRWRWARWLVGNPPLLAWAMQVLAPLAKLFGLSKAIARAHQLRRRLLASPTACRLLFKRRRAEIESELLQEQLDWLKVPALILQGDDGTNEAARLSQAYASALPKADLKVLAGSEEDLPEACADPVASLITMFVATCKPL